MIIAHSIQHSYYHFYNKHLTYFVLIGFVFLSGITLGSIYREKYLKAPSICMRAIYSRAAKLLAIFIFANVVIMLINPNSILNNRVLEVKDIIFSAITRDGETRFSFSVLIAISFTFIASTVFLSWKSLFLDILLIALGVLLLWTIEIYDYINYYTIKMTIVGILGILLGKILNSIDFTKIKNIFVKMPIAFWVCYIIYQVVLIAIYRQWELKVSHYVIITLFLLLAVYFTSFRYGLSKNRFVQILNSALANHMLFAYLFHLSVLKIFSSHIRGIDMEYSITLGILNVIITILGGLIINKLIALHIVFKRTYNFVFK